MTDSENHDLHHPATDPSLIHNADISADSYRYLGLLQHFKRLTFELTIAQYEVFDKMYQRLMAEQDLATIDIDIIEHTVKQELKAEAIDVLMPVLTTTLSVMLNHGSLSTETAAPFVHLRLAM